MPPPCIPIRQMNVRYSALCGRCEAQPMRSASETTIPSGPRTARPAAVTKRWWPSPADSSRASAARTAGSGQSSRGPGDLTAQDGKFIAEDQDLDILRRLAAAKQLQPAKDPGEGEVQESDPHRPQSCPIRVSGPNRRSRPPCRVWSGTGRRPANLDVSGMCGRSVQEARLAGTCRRSCSSGRGVVGVRGPGQNCQGWPLLPRPGGLGLVDVAGGSTGLGRTTRLNTSPSPCGA